MGAPPGNTNAIKHGAYAAGEDGVDLTEAIVDLQRRLRHLSAYIDGLLNAEPPMDTETYLKLAALQGNLTSRLGRLIRDRRQGAGDEGSQLEAAINAALDEISQELGIEL